MTEEGDLYQICLSRCTRDDERQRLVEEWKLLRATNTFSILYRFFSLLPYLEGNWFVRGSAGCSMTVYLLGGSLFHPIDFDLSLERFTNVHRKTLGDVDIDVVPSLRPIIFQRLATAFPGQVGRMSNRVCLREKSAKKYYFSKILKSVSHHWSDDHLQEAKQLEGQFHYFSLHVGGLCFWEKGIPSKHLLAYSPTVSLPQLRLDKHDVQREKIFKFDLLNNHALGFLQEIDPSFSWKRFSPELCTDKKVWDAIQKGDTLGVLYGESPMMKRCLRLIQPSSVMELGLCFALIRPMNRRTRYRMEKDPGYAEYVRKMKEPYFDDDWIRWLAKRHKLSLADADAMRRRITKDPNESRIKGYGFCRSHALHYALLIYTQTYYKLYFPLDFYRILLNHHKKQTRMYDKWVYVLDAAHHSVFLKDVPSHKKTPLHKSGAFLVPKDGIQRRLRPLPILQQIQQSGGLFPTRKEMSFLLFHFRVASFRKLTPSLTTVHVYDAYNKEFVDKIVCCSTKN